MLAMCNNLSQLALGPLQVAYAISRQMTTLSRPWVGGLLQSTSYFLDAKKVWTVDKDRLMMRKPSFSLLTPLLVQHCAIPQKVCPAGHCASSVTESGTHRLTIGTSAFPKSGGAVNLVLVNAMWGKQSVLHNTGGNSCIT